MSPERLTKETKEEVESLRRQRLLHRAWQYEGGSRSAFRLSVEDWLTLIEEGNINYPEDFEEDKEEIVSLMESEPSNDKEE